MLALALKAGARLARRCWSATAPSSEVKVRLGEPELIKEAGSRALGLRVIKDERAAVTYTSDLSAAGMERFARDSVELAALAEPDPIAALPAREEMARSVPELDLWDEGVLSLDVAEGIRRARAGEAAALAFDKRVTNSDGAVFGRTVGASAFATSAGFSGSVRGTHVSFAVEPLCDDADGKKRNGSFWTASRFAAGLADAAEVGVEAARRTVAKLGARKIPTGAAPVIFSADAARGLLGQLAGRDVGWRESGGVRATSPAAKGRRSRRRWSRSSTIRCFAEVRDRGRSTGKAWRAGPTS
jgi:PmbA protein